MSVDCTHLDLVADVTPSSGGCEDCTTTSPHPVRYLDDIAFEVQDAPSFAHP